MGSFWSSPNNTVHIDYDYVLKFKNIQSHLVFQISSMSKLMNQIQYVKCKFYELEKLDKTKRVQVTVEVCFCENKDEQKKLFFIPLSSKLKVGYKYEWFCLIVTKNQNIIQVANDYIIKHFQDIQIQADLDQNIKKQMDGIQKNVDLIIQEQYHVNILLAGKVGLGKTTFIQNIFQQFHLKKNVKFEPLIANCQKSVTKQFKIYDLIQKNMTFIDSPGFDTQYDVKERIQLYQKILRGQFNYNQYQFPNKVSVDKSKLCFLQQNYAKIIHIVVLFIDLNQTEYLKQLNQSFINLCIEQEICYITVINKIDKQEYGYNNQMYARILQTLKAENYMIQNSNRFNSIFPITLKQYKYSNQCKYVYYVLLNQIIQKGYNKVQSSTIKFMIQKQGKKHSDEVVKLWQKFLKKKTLREIFDQKFPNKTKNNLKIKYKKQWVDIDHAKYLDKYITQFITQKTLILRETVQ